MEIKTEMTITIKDNTDYKRLEKDLYAIFDFAVEFVGLKDAFEKWNTEVFYGVAQESISGKVDEQYLNTLCKVYRLRLENKYKKEMADNFNQYVEHAEKI